MLNPSQIEFYARLQESRLKPEQISFQVEIMQSTDDVFWGNFEKVDFFFPSPAAIIKFLHDRYPSVLYYQIKCVPFPPACPQDYLFIDNPSHEFSKRSLWHFYNQSSTNEKPVNNSFVLALDAGYYNVFLFRNGLFEFRPLYTVPTSLTGVDKWSYIPLSPKL